MGMGWSLRQVVGLVALAVLMGCHEPGQVRSVEAAATMDQDALDFGEVPVGEWSERVVRLRNVGYVPFSALDALNLEGNPSYEVRFEGRGRVGPGEEKEVLVRFRPLAEGLTSETLQVRTDANLGREHTLAVKGQGIPARIQVEPRVLDFETLEVDSERTLPLTVTNPGELPLTVTLAEDATGAFGADAVTIPPLSSRQVSARYLPRQVGAMQARVEVRACATCTPTVAELSGRSVASAFVFEPAPVPFAQIPVHERTQSRTRARNVTWRPVTISALSTSDRAFAPLQALQGREVKPGEEVEVPLEFAARSMGPLEGLLTVAYASDKERKTDVLLDARGGHPTLAVAPLALDFGELPVGGKLALGIRITNGGSNGNLHFRGVRATGHVSHFNVDVPMRGKQAFAWRTGTTWPVLEVADVPVAPAGDALDLKVYFEPKEAGTFQATLALVSDDQWTPERTLVITGRARATAACVYELLPQPALDFGNVAPGQSGVLGFHFRNPGRAECAVKDIHISNDGGGAFTLPGGNITGGIVPYDTAFSAMVSFRPPAAGTFTGELKLTVNDPSKPTVTLPLKGVSQASCLVAAPPFVWFGPIRYDCATVPRRTLVSNQCAVPVTVNEAWVGTGTSRQYSLVEPLPAPRTLAPGEGFELEVAYARNVLGQHFSPLFVSAAGETSPLLIALLAETNHEGLQVDRFTQGAVNQLDVLFVVSNTTTMETFQKRLQAAIPGWLERAKQAGVDVRVGVTTTALAPRANYCGGPVKGGEAGRLVPVDGSRERIVSGGATGAAARVQANLEVGLCHNLVQGLEAARQTLSSPLATSADDPRTPLPNDGNLGFLRPTARLAVVAVADEDDKSGFEVESYVQFFQALKGTGMAHRTQFHALVPMDKRCTTAGDSGARFAEVARRTGGEASSICQGDYSPLLDKLLQRATGLQADFTLSGKPNGTEEMVVRVNGRRVAPELWTYDASRNALVFSPEAVPQTGQSLEVRYRSPCGALPPTTPRAP
jgi:hypothetical protein